MLFALSPFWTWTLIICALFALAGIIVAIVYYSKSVINEKKKQQGSSGTTNLGTNTKISPKSPPKK